MGCIKGIFTPAAIMIDKIKYYDMQQVTAPHQHTTAQILNDSSTDSHELVHWLYLNWNPVPVQANKNETDCYTSTVWVQYLRHPLQSIFYYWINLTTIMYNVKIVAHNKDDGWLSQALYDIKRAYSP